MAKQIWKIRGYDGFDQIFERDVAGNLSESQVIALLQRLASRHLCDDEIVSASLRKNASGYAPHLEVRPINGKVRGLTTIGTGCYYTAVSENRENV